MSTRIDRPIDVNLDSAPQQREYNLIVGRLIADQPGRVLDWGTGHGQIAARLQDSGIEVAAFDYDPDLTEPTVRSLERFPTVDVHLSPDPVRLPFDNNSFDSVLSCGVLEHVVSPADSLDELKRVLRPGGTLYIYKLPNRFSYLEWIAKKLGLYYHGKLPHDTLYTERSAVELVNAHGYDVLESGLANMLPLTLPGVVAERAAGTIFSLNRLLARIPGLRLLATNVELIAKSPETLVRREGSVD